MTDANPNIIELPSIDHVDAWDTPILFDEINTPEIPANLLPNCLGEFAAALATETETPESLSVMTILGVISASVAKRFVISPKDGWFEPINIYTAIGLPPANNKSLVLKRCTTPLIQWEKEQAKLLETKLKQEQSQRKTEEKIIESLRTKAARSKDVSEQQRIIKEVAEKEAALTEPSVLPILFTNDATPESLATLAHEQDGRCAIFTDEGGIIEALGGLYSNGVSNTDILLKGIDGGEIRVRRKDRSFQLNAYLTIVLAVQPAIIESMGNKRAYMGNGALERFLFLLPRSKLGFRTHDKPSIPINIEQAYQDKIKSLLEIPTPLQDKQQTHFVLKLSPQAKLLWQKFQNEIEKDLRPDGRLTICQGWGGKICGFALRIAGLLHVAIHELHQLIIDEHIMKSALQIATFLTEHAIAAYGLIGIDQPTQDAKDLFCWIKKNGKTSFTKSNLALAMRNKRIGKRERLTKALDVLADRNLISTPQTLPTRKPTTIYYVNPEVFEDSNN